MDPLEVQVPLKAGSNQPRISLSLECFKCGGWIFGGNELSEIQIKCSDSEAVICNLQQTNSFHDIIHKPKIFVAGYDIV